MVGEVLMVVSKKRDGISTVDDCENVVMNI